MTCHPCRLALSKGHVKEAQFRETGFLTGFRNWKKGVERFRIHALSDVHLEVMSKMAMSRRPIDVVMTDTQIEEQQRNRVIFIEILGMIRGLARSGAPLRGHAADDGFLMRMLQERAATDPQIASWMRRSKNFLSHDCQDELISIMATMVQRDLVNAASRSGFFSIIADGTTDICGKEQFSVCLRFVDDDLTPKEKFVGMYECPDSGGETLAKAVLDVTVRLMGGTTKLRGQCYDGASNMSGRLSGVQARIREVQPKALYVHCTNHSLDLALTEQAREIGLVSDVMVLVRDVSSCLNTGKRHNMLREHVIESMETHEDSAMHGGGPPRKLLALCPTRWTVRAAAFKRFLEQYDAVLKTLEDLQEDKGVATDVRSKIRGQVAALRAYETVFGMVVCQAVFTPCELFARQLQTPSLNMSEVTNGAALLIDTLTAMRTEGEFEKMCVRVDRIAEKLDGEILPPKKRRKKKPPKRFEHQSQTTPDADLDPKEELRRVFYQILDLVTGELKRRFDQPGIAQLKKIEQLLLQPGEVGADDITSMVGIFGENDCNSGKDVDVELLRAQLAVMRNSEFAQGAKTVTELASVLEKQGTVVQNMLSEVVKLVRLFLTVPVSGASSERSFSALRHIKTYLRSTMRQSRLSHLLLLYVHQEQALSLDLKRVLDDFVRNRPERRASTLGYFGE